MLSAYLIWNDSPMSSAPAFRFNFAIKVISCYMSETCNLETEKIFSKAETSLTASEISVNFYALQTYHLKYL